MTRFGADRIARLRGFGLSEYASRAYLALLELGTTEAREVSRLAKVPLAKVYSTLDQLQERGLVAVEPGPPKRFTPAPFSAYIQRRRARIGSELKELEVAERETAELFPVRGNVTADDRGAFFMLRGRESVVEKFLSLVRTTQEDILLLTADNFAKRPHVEEFFGEAAERGVELRALVRVDEDSVATLRKMTGQAELRAKESAPGSPGDVAIAVFDHRQLMIIHFVPDDPSRYEGKDVAIVASEGAMVRAIRSILAAQWEEAEPFEHAAARLASGLPRTRTTMYNDLRETFDMWRAGIAAARGTHEIIGTRPVSALPPLMLDALREASARGIRQRAVFIIDDDAACARVRAALGPNGELRSAPMGSLQRVSIMDGQDVFFGPSSRARDPTHVDELTIRTNDPAAVRVLRAYFEDIWAASTPV